MGLINVEIKGLDKINKYFEDFPDIYEKEVGQASKKSIILIEGQAVMEAPVDRGNLRAKRKKFANHLGGFIKFFANYAVFVHEGTRAHFPPVMKGKGLDLWARRKNINAWAVAKAMSRKGTKRNPFLERAVKKRETKVNSLFNKALKGIVQAIKK